MKGWNLHSLSFLKSNCRPQCNSGWPEFCTPLTCTWPERGVSSGQDKTQNGQQNVIHIGCEALRWMGRLLYSCAWRREVWYKLTDVWEVTAAFIIWLDNCVQRNSNCLAFSFNRKNWQEWISTNTLCLLYASTKLTKRSAETKTTSSNPKRTKLQCVA
jgi:hypothetical protein